MAALCGLVRRTPSSARWAVLALRHGFLAAGSLLLMSFEARTEEDPKVGLNIKVGNTGGSINSSVGLLVHATKRLSLRPSLRFERNTVEIRDSAVNQSRTESLWGGKVDVLFRLGQARDVSPYVGVGIGFLRTMPSETPPDPDHGESTRVWSGELLIGLQYSLHRRVGLYGELGVSRLRSTTPTVIQTHWTTFDAGVGFVFYF